MTDVRRLIVRGALAAAMVAAGPLALRLVADGARPEAWAASNTGDSAAGAFGSFLAGMHAKQDGDFGAAADYLSSVLKQDPKNVQLLQDTFLAMASSGRLGEAAGLGEKLEAQDAGSDPVSLILAVTDLKAGRIEAATSRLAALSDSGLNQFTLPLVRAWAALERGKLDEALAALEPLAKVKGVESLYDLHVGLLNEVGGRPAAAAAGYERAVADSDKLSFRTVELVGSFYQRQKETDKARALYEKFRVAYPDNALLPMLVERQDDTRPAPIVGSARDGLAEALFDLASVLYQESARDMALVYARMALDLRGDNPAAQVLLGNLVAADRHYVDAVTIYRAVDQKSPFGWQARLALADALQRIEATDEAISLLREMAAERANSADAPMMLGDILRSAERFEESAKAYDDAIARIGELKPQHWSLLYYRGISYERSKQWERAEADFLRALEFEPDQPYVLNYLAYSWVDKGMNFDRSLAMLNKAVEQKPDDGYIVDSLGWVYFRLGKFDLAVEQLENAVELVPQDAVINDHLGDAFWRVGRHVEARFQWRRSLNLNPEADQIAPIKSKIENGMPASSSGT